MIVKICGITRAEDARAAVEAGASAIGFIFWPGSPRYIDPYRARDIVRQLPPFVTAVGVFVDQPRDHVSGVASLARLGALQLHGKETPAAAATLCRPVLKGITLEDPVDTWPESVLLLLDAHDPVQHGGTGRAINWERAARVAARRRVILAGGLTPDNVGDALARVRPYGIDVSSGVEESPGIKHHGRIRALFEALHAQHLSPRS
ncbi:MAG TPA: phosphoribosylanthranilate isomerase [Vicinamibacterales bacterium]